MSNTLTPCDVVVVDSATAQYPASGSIHVGLLDTSSNFSADDTVTIGTTVYTFKADPSSTAFAVDIGGDAATSLANLKAAINLSGTPDTEYGAGTTQHPWAIAEDIDTGDRLKVTAPGGIGAGVAYTLAETGSASNWENPAGVAITEMPTWRGLATTTFAHSIWQDAEGGVIYAAWVNSITTTLQLEVQSVGGQLLFSTEFASGAVSSAIARNYGPGVRFHGGFRTLLSAATGTISIAYSVY